MTEDERSVLERLDKILGGEQIRRHIRSVVERVRAELARKSEAVMTWEPIQLEVFGDALPPGIRSAWVFVLRAGADTGAERHPNSHQRMMTLEGTGDMRTVARGSDPKSEIEWESNILVSDPNASLHDRWISIPRNVWHRPVIPKTTDWVVVSFHTVPAEELIEERPDADATGGTKQMRYIQEENDQPSSRSGGTTARQANDEGDDESMNREPRSAIGADERRTHQLRARNDSRER